MQEKLDVITSSFLPHFQKEESEFPPIKVERVYEDIAGAIAKDSHLEDSFESIKNKVSNINQEINQIIAKQNFQSLPDKVQQYNFRQISTDKSQKDVVEDLPFIPIAKQDSGNKIIPSDSYPSNQKETIDEPDQAQKEYSEQARVSGFLANQNSKNQDSRRLTLDENSQSKNIYDPLQKQKMLQSLKESGEKEQKQLGPQQNFYNAVEDWSNNNVQFESLQDIKSIQGDEFKKVMTDGGEDVALIVSQHDKSIYRQIITQAMGTQTYDEDDYVIRITNQKQLAQKLTLPSKKENNMFKILLEKLNLNKETQDFQEISVVPEIDTESGDIYLRILISQRYEIHIKNQAQDEIVIEDQNKSQINERSNTLVNWENELSLTKQKTKQLKKKIQEKSFEIQYLSLFKLRDTKFNLEAQILLNIDQKPLNKRCLLNPEIFLSHKNVTYFYKKEPSVQDKFKFTLYRYKMSTTPVCYVFGQQFDKQNGIDKVKWGEIDGLEETDSVTFFIDAHKDHNVQWQQKLFTREYLSTKYVMVKPQLYAGQENWKQNSHGLKIYRIYDFLKNADQQFEARLVAKFEDNQFLSVINGFYVDHSPNQVYFTLKGIDYDYGFTLFERIIEQEAKQGEKEKTYRKKGEILQMQTIKRAYNYRRQEMHKIHLYTEHQIDLPFFQKQEQNLYWNMYPNIPSQGLLKPMGIQKPSYQTYFLQQGVTTQIELVYPFTYDDQITQVQQSVDGQEDNEWSQTQKKMKKNIDEEGEQTKQNSLIERNLEYQQIQVIKYIFKNTFQKKEAKIIYSDVSDQTDENGRSLGHLIFNNQIMKALFKNPTNIQKIVFNWEEMTLSLGTYFQLITPEILLVAKKQQVVNLLFLKQEPDFCKGDVSKKVQELQDRENQTILQSLLKEQYMAEKDKVSEGVYPFDKPNDLQINQLKHNGLHNIYLYPDFMNRIFLTHNSVYLPEISSNEFQKHQIISKNIILLPDRQKKIIKYLKLHSNLDYQLNFKKYFVSKSAKQYAFWFDFKYFNKELHSQFNQIEEYDESKMVQKQSVTILITSTFDEVQTCQDQDKTLINENTCVLVFFSLKDIAYMKLKHLQKFSKLIEFKEQSLKINFEQVQDCSKQDFDYLMPVIINQYQNKDQANLSNQDCENFFAILDLNQIIIKKNSLEYVLLLNQLDEFFQQKPEDKVENFLGEALSYLKQKKNSSVEGFDNNLRSIKENLSQKLKYYFPGQQEENFFNFIDQPNQISNDSQQQEGPINEDYFEEDQNQFNIFQDLLNQFTDKQKLYTQFEQQFIKNQQTFINIQKIRCFNSPFASDGQILKRYCQTSQLRNQIRDACIFTRCSDFKNITSLTSISEKGKEFVVSYQVGIPFRSKEINFYEIWEFEVQIFVNNDQVDLEKPYFNSDQVHLLQSSMDSDIKLVNKGTIEEIFEEKVGRFQKLQQITKQQRSYIHFNQKTLRHIFKSKNVSKKSAYGYKPNEQKFHRFWFENDRLLPNIMDDGKFKSEQFYFLINLFTSKKPVYVPFPDIVQLDKTYKKGKQNSNKFMSKIAQNFFVNKISKKNLCGFFDDGTQADLAISTLSYKTFKQIEPQFFYEILTLDPPSISNDQPFQITQKEHTIQQQRSNRVYECITTLGPQFFTIFESGFSFIKNFHDPLFNSEEIIQELYENQKVNFTISRSNFLDALSHETTGMYDKEINYFQPRSVLSGRNFCCLDLSQEPSEVLKMDLNQLKLSLMGPLLLQKLKDQKLFQQNQDYNTFFTENYFQFDQNFIGDSAAGSKNERYSNQPFSFLKNSVLSEICKPMQPSNQKYSYWQLDQFCYQFDLNHLYNLEINFLKFESLFSKCLDKRYTKIANQVLQFLFKEGNPRHQRIIMQDLPQLLSIKDNLSIEKFFDYSPSNLPKYQDVLPKPGEVSVQKQPNDISSGFSIELTLCNQKLPDLGSSDTQSETILNVDNFQFFRENIEQNLIEKEQTKQNEQNIDLSNELEHSYIDFRHTIRKVKADQVLFSRYENFKAENQKRSLEYLQKFPVGNQVSNLFLNGIRYITNFQSIVIPGKAHEGKNPMTELFISYLIKQQTHNPNFFNSKTVQTLIDRQFVLGQKRMKYIFWISLLFIFLPLVVFIVARYNPEKQPPVLINGWTFSSADIVKIVSLSISLAFSLLMLLTVDGPDIKFNGIINPFKDSINFAFVSSVQNIFCITVYVLELLTTGRKIVVQITSNGQEYQDDYNVLKLIENVLLIILLFLDAYIVTYSIRFAQSYSFLIQMLVEVVQDVIPFCIIYILFIAVISNGLLVLDATISNENYPNLHPVIMMMLQVFSNSIGNIASFRYGPWTPVDQNLYGTGEQYVNIGLVWTFWLINIFGLLIVLLNFLISKISETYSRVVEEGSLFIYKQKANINFEMFLIMDASQFYSRYVRGISITKSVENIQEDGHEHEAKDDLVNQLTKAQTSEIENLKRISDLIDSKLKAFAVQSNNFAEQQKQKNIIKE